ncbi:MAG: hypothetical protein Udaeo_06020 [Candidatus Udaeobacter sp.]|nr:MAG: hypothetical protein Udaeo_06020 [Candidatus Udaeobacter sp.]
MNQLCLFFVADFGKNTRRFRVNPKRAIAFGLASIDIRERCRVNQHVEIHCAQFSAHIIQIRQVKLSMIEASEIVFISILTHQRRTESPCRSDNYNFHLF